MTNEMKRRTPASAWAWLLLSAVLVAVSIPVDGLIGAALAVAGVLAAVRVHAVLRQPARTGKARHR